MVYVVTAPPLDEAACALPLGVHAVGAARHFVEATVPGWGADPEQTATAALLASELVTNAVLYGYGAATLRLAAAAGVLRISVTDGASAPPALREAGDEAEIGRGLHVVEACSLGWGVEPREDGKTVWCELALSGG